MSFQKVSLPELSPTPLVFKLEKMPKYEMPLRKLTSSWHWIVEDIVVHESDVQIRIRIELPCKLVSMSLLGPAREFCGSWLQIERFASRIHSQVQSAALRLGRQVRHGPWVWRMGRWMGWGMDDGGLVCLMSGPWESDVWCGVWGLGSAG